MVEKLYDLHKIDARQIDKIIKKKIISTTITSPPYFDLKDYGFDNQIGFGQEYNEYLDEDSIIRHCLECLKKEMDF